MRFMLQANQHFVAEQNLLWTKGTVPVGITLVCNKLLSWRASQALDLQELSRSERPLSR